MSDHRLDKIVFLDRDTTDRGDVDFSGIESLGELVSYPTSTREETAARIADATIILTTKPSSEPPRWTRQKISSSSRSSPPE